MAVKPTIAVLYLDHRELGLAAQLLDLIRLTKGDSTIAIRQLEPDILPRLHARWDAAIFVGTASSRQMLEPSTWISIINTSARRRKTVVFYDADEEWIHKVRPTENIFLINREHYTEQERTIVNNNIMNFLSLSDHEVGAETSSEPRPDGSATPESPPTDPEREAVRVAAATKVTNLEQAPLGAMFETEAEKLVIDPSGSETDFEVAGKAVVHQVHQEIIRKAAHFAAVAYRLDNQVGWQGIRSASERLSVLLKRPTEHIPDVLGSLYSATLEMGSFLELDLAIGRGDASYGAPLDAEARRPLEDLVRNLAPWMRSFPSIREMDNEAGQFLVPVPPLRPSEEVVDVAARVEIVDAEDATALRALIAAAGRGEFQGEKAGHRGTLSVRNMIVVATGVLGSFMLGAVGSDFATKSVLVKKAGSFLAQAEAPLMEVIAGLPYDIRYAIQAILREVQKSPAVPPQGVPSPAREGVDPVRRRRQPRT